jgi:acyl phosphate:glycerol-3-phosphate acyltransferase
MALLAAGLRILDSVMNGSGILLAVTLLAYLIGSIPFGYLVARSRGVDILRQGSGNIGATNVGRVLGKRCGILVFLLDFAKGAVPVAVAAWVGDRVDSGVPTGSLAVAAGLAAFLGHLFPIYLGFRGGKGVATGAGVVAVLLPVPAAGAILTWLAVLCLTRYVSLASLAAVSILCALRVALTAESFAPDQRILTVFCFAAAALVFVRHRGNIHRLLQGTENRLQDRTTMLISKTLHVLPLGLWFGSSVFFSLVATPAIFHTFAALAEQPPDARPSWLPSTFAKENATQLAGLAVGPIFPWYFLLQGVCGFLTVVTALTFLRAEPRAAIHKLRFGLVAAALVTVVVGWPIAHQVSIFRAARYDADPLLAQAAREQFATWHLYSLGLNLITLALVTVAMALAARLPPTLGSVEKDPGVRRTDLKSVPQ